MNIFLAIILVLFAIFLVLWQKFKISYELTAENFNISVKADISWCGKKVLDKEKKEKKKKPDNEINSPKKKAKIKLSDITVIKDAVLAALPAVFKILKKSVGLDEFETDIRLALSDPMENGIAYGAVCGAANILYAGIMKIYPGKKYFLDIEHDFKSGEGVILSNKGKLYVRLCKVLFWAAAVFVTDKKIRKALRDIKKTFR